MNMIVIDGNTLMTKIKLRHGRHDLVIWKVGGQAIEEDDMESK